MLPRKRALLERGFCLTVLALVPVLLLVPLHLDDALPLDLWDILFAPPWQEARPAGMAPSASFLSELTAQRFYPAYAHLNEAAHEKRSLLWDDGQGFGMPFMALWRTRVLSPFSLPFYFLPLHMAFLVSVLAKWVLAGWFAYYAARRFAFPAALALFIALSYQLSAPLTIMPVAPLADAMPWLPLLVLRLERLVLGDLRAWPRAALVLGLIALSGSPELLALSIVFALIYLAARRAMEPNRVRTGDAVTGLTLAILFGLGLAALQWVPYLEFLSHGGWRGTTSAASTPLAALLGILAPGLALAGDPGASTLTQLYHVGLLPVLLLPLWLSLRQFVEASHRRQMESFLLVSVLLAAVPLLVGGVLSRVPLLDSLGPQHFLPFLGLAFAFLAAGALEEWVRLDADQCKATLRRLLLWGPMIWLLYFAGLAFVLTRPDVQFPTKTLLLTLGTALVILILLVITLLRPRIGLLGYGAALVAGLGLWWGSQPVAPRTAAALAFPETAFVTAVGDLDTLIAGTRELENWPLSCNGIRQVYAPGGAYLDRHEDFLREAEKNPLLLRRTGAKALLLTKESVRGAFAQIRHALSIHEIFSSGAVLMRDLEAQPRARMIHEARTMAPYDPGLLSADLPPLTEGGALPLEDNGPVVGVTMTDDTHGGRVTVNIDDTRPGMLVLADAYYPGWNAVVDGAPAPIHAVDVAFRGVEVGMGEHEVVFRYEPLSLRLGGLISLAALLVVGYNLLPRLRRRRIPQ